MTCLLLNLLTNLSIVELCNSHDYSRPIRQSKSAQAAVLDVLEDDRTDKPDRAIDRLELQRLRRLILYEMRCGTAV